jgi:DNA-binding HxlR family transcriptional regulator
MTREPEATYGQFCPVAMASEIICKRWTMLVIRELLCGSTRFNDLRRGVPRMSPTLLSARLKELEEAGIIRSVREAPSGPVSYHLTEAGEELRPIVMALGNWGQHWIRSGISLRHLDPSLLMWDMRRRLDPRPLPKHRCTIRFHYPDAARGQDTYWLVVEPDGAIDLCAVDPGHDVDLFVNGSLHAMTSVWMGHSEVAGEVEAGRIVLTGDAELCRTMQSWLGLSIFAGEKSRRPATPSPPARAVTRASPAAP